MYTSASLAKDSLVYSYERSFSGFAAKLTDEEASRISEMKGVVSVTPNSMLKLHTTRSWDFMGFTKDNVEPALEEDVIIGFLDTGQQSIFLPLIYLCLSASAYTYFSPICLKLPGVWPEHPSFNDSSYGPPPAKWKGTCQSTDFTCNK